MASQRFAVATNPCRYTLLEENKWQQKYRILEKAGALLLVDPALPESEYDIAQIPKKQQYGNPNLQVLVGISP